MSIATTVVLIQGLCLLLIAILNRQIGEVRKAAEKLIEVTQQRRRSLL
jgi:hypothetical protein